MNHNERELEQAGYDNWKLDNGEGMRKHIFVTREKEGRCPCCDDNVYDDQLFVEEDNNVYHFSCYNEMKKEDEDNE